MARWTNFPNGITSLGIPTFGTGSLPPYTGNYFFVQEVTTAGVAAGAGTAQSPFNTIEQALAECVSGNDDVIFLTGSVHATKSIAWNLNETHLVGVCAPIKRGKRARISAAGTTAGWNKGVNVTGYGCHFTNFQLFYGWSNTSAALIAWEDDGGRNCYNNVEFMGFGDQTTSTGSSNLTGSRAFKMNTNVGETTFRGCVFGVDTAVRNVANYTVEIVGGAPRLTFEDCDFEADLGSSGGGSSHLLIGVDGIDRYLDMARCNFWNTTKSGGTAMTQALNVSGTAGGFVQLRDCTGFGFTHWETSASGSVVINMPVPTAHDGGIAIAASPS